MGAGWFWDAGNGLGFAAYAGLLYLVITSSGRLNVRAHQLLGFAVLFIASCHALWFLLGDGAAVEFIKIGAPDYMWLGIVGLFLFFLLVMFAMVPDRFRVHRDYSSFRYWHGILAVTCVACSTYHIVVSRFYLLRWYQALLLVAFAGAALFGRRFWSRLAPLPIASPTAFILVSVVLTALFSAARNWSG